MRCKKLMVFAVTLCFSLALTGLVTSISRPIYFRASRQHAFCEAASKGQIWKMRLLRLAGSNINECISGCMPLITLSSKNQVNHVRYLLDEGADVNEKANFGMTPLMMAAYHGNTEVLRLLLSRGADVNAVNDMGKTAFYIAADMNQVEVVDLLLSNGAGKGSDGQQALRSAVEKDRTELVALLFSKGITID